LQISIPFYSQGNGNQQYGSSYQKPSYRPSTDVIPKENMFNMMNDMNEFDSMTSMNPGE